MEIKNIVFPLFLLCYGISFSQKEENKAIIAGKINIDNQLPNERKPCSIFILNDKSLLSENPIDTINYTFKVELSIDKLTYFNIAINNYPNVPYDSLWKNYLYTDSIHIPEILSSHRPIPVFTMVLEPNDSLFIEIELSKSVIKRIVNNLEEKNIYSSPSYLYKYTLSGTKEAVGNNNYFLKGFDINSIGYSINFNESNIYIRLPIESNNYFRLPIEKALYKTDSIKGDQYKRLEKFKSKLSNNYYLINKYDIYFNNLNLKHRYIVAHLYSDSATKVSIKAEARKLYGFMDEVEFKNEFLISTVYKEFIDNYMQYMQRMITGKDITSYDLNPYYLARATLTGKTKEWYLYRNINLNNAANFTGNLPLYYDYITEYPESENSRELKEIYDRHKSILPGNNVPNLIITLKNGKKISLKKLKGKVVVLLSDYLLYNYSNNTLFNKFFNLNEIFKGEDIQFITLEHIPRHYTYSFTIGRLDKKRENPFSGSATIKDNPENIKAFQFPDMENFFIINKEGIIEPYPASLKIQYIYNDLLKLLKEPYNKASVIKSFLQNNASLIVILFSIIIAIFLVFLLSVNFKRRQQTMKKLQLQSELKAIRSQLNPHFLFNSLNSIQNYIAKCDSETANIQLSKFALLMRRVLEISEQDNITLKEEIDFITSYIELEKARFGFELNIDIEKDIDIYNIEIPSMLIQPFVENAIKHAMSNLGNKGELNISIKETSHNEIFFKIKDNGIGIKKKPENGFGLKSSMERINIINSQNRKKILIEIESPADIVSNNGTSVILTIPKKY